MDPLIEKLKQKEKQTLIQKEKQTQTQIHWRSKMDPLIEKQKENCFLRH